MASDKNQRAVFDFLREKLEKQDTFTISELKGSTTWTEKTWKTYLPKQLAVFLKQVAGNKFRVSEAFRPYSQWSRFRKHVSQVRAAQPTYAYEPAPNVLIFDFYLPLANEEHLRSTLDSLFYKDTILRKLTWEDKKQIERHFPSGPNETPEAFYERVCDWISEKLIGYSISHVSGRFRARKLSTRAEALEASTRGDRYLVDETTAVTRFIFPCKGTDEAEQVTWFFKLLFVDTVKELVSGEDEILMLESGLRNQVHRWALKD